MCEKITQTYQSQITDDFCREKENNTSLKSAQMTFLFIQNHDLCQIEVPFKEDSVPLYTGNNR